MQDRTPMSDTSTVRWLPYHIVLNDVTYYSGWVDVAACPELEEFCDDGPGVPNAHRS